jgi:predicted  nucleic acid-binding Zn-ribbon protein
MKKELEQRLKALRSELEAGQKMLADLNNKASNVRETTLRISGAIQVLEEEIAQTEEESNDPPSNIVRKKKRGDA